MVLSVLSFNSSINLMFIYFPKCGREKEKV